METLLCFIIKNDLNTLQRTPSYVYLTNLICILFSQVIHTGSHNIHFWLAIPKILPLLIGSINENALYFCPFFTFISFYSYILPHVCCLQKMKHPVVAFARIHRPTTSNQQVGESVKPIATTSVSGRFLTSLRSLVSSLVSSLRT